ncbi:MAG: hypothetical protein WCB27_20880 [Thermoguttaceae bacterium]|jgi:hypothetical protein
MMKTDGVFTSAALSAPVRRAFSQLIEVHELARASGRKDSDFAAEITSLTELGISGSVLRWLVCRGYAKCLREVTQPGDKERRFEPADNLSLNSQSCFVLSRKGMLFARAVLAFGNAGAEAAQANGNNGDSARQGNGLAPSWDAKRRELRLFRKLLKRFRVPAPNQEAILAAFQEEGWPNCIDDPLPPKGDLSPQRRLHDTIKALNRKHRQKPPLIHFLGNGTGKNVVWELRMAPRRSHPGKRKDQGNR